MSGPTLRGTAGPVQLGALLAKGGEGAVYEVAGRPDVVAKVYLKAVSSERADKLAAMQSMLTPTLAALTAWPAELLRTPNGAIAGFLMPNLRGSKDIHALYGPRSRLAQFPQADWRMLVRAAVNTAKAFAVLHHANCLVADVNHGGVRVAPDATVKLIDCDSFQVVKGTRTFLCEVGVENFTPPELQGKSFQQTLRTANHDNFGLAVLIFHLLMVGRHPFAGRYSGPEDMPIPKAIGQYRYAYGRDKGATGMQPPPLSPPVAVAGAEIASLWEGAFSKSGTAANGRPTAAQWVAALAKVEKSFVRCTRHGGHFYFSGLSSCPWCPIESHGPVLFPLPAGTTPVSAHGPFNLDAVWAHIRAVPSPGGFAVPAPPAPPAPSPDALRLKANRDRRKGIGAGIAAVLLLAAIVLVPGLWWVWLPVAYFAWNATANTGAGDEVSALKARHDHAQAQLREVSARVARDASASSFDVRLEQLRVLKDEWVGLPASRQRQYNALVASRERDALVKFLDGFEIMHASISGIGSAKKSMLESFGIETAADVNANAVLAVPGFGPALTQRLLDWRKGVQQRFRFDARSGVDPKLIGDLDRAIMKRRSDIEAELRAGANSLLQVRASVMTRRHALEAQLKQAAIAAAQAAADLKVVS